ncbi:MAG: Ig-like domain-containing protein, partial [Anaerolineales bacterium]
MIGLLLVVSLACSLPWVFPSPPEEPAATPEGTTPEPTGFVITPTPTSPPPRLPPLLVESDPPPGVEISAIGPITLYFNQSMDRVSVEDAITSQQSLSVEFLWEDNATVTIIPEVPFSPASRIEFLLDENVLAANGLFLTEPQVLTYDVEGYLQLTGMIPQADASDVTPTSAVVAGFNRPIRPIEDSDDHFPAFWLQPEVEGRGEWINASTYIFYPESALEGGTEYTVHVDPDLLSLSGAPLQEAYTWSFTTLPLQMVSIVPTPGARSVRLDSQVMLQFNQPMDMESVETNLILLDPDSRPVPGEFIWNEELTQVSYKPRYFLKRDLNYTFLLTDGARTLGGTRINAPVETNWRTNPSLEIVGVEPSQNESIDVHEHLIVYFSAPIQPRNILQFVSLIPRVEGLNASLEDGGRTLHLSGNFTPETHYSLIISPNLPDAWSGRLGADFVLNFSTNPLEPELLITEEHDIFFVTPQDSSLVVEATNLEQITYSLGSLPLDVFTQMLSTNGFSFLESFIPEDRIAFQQGLELSPNRREKIEIPLSPNDTPLSPGLYQVVFNQSSNEDPIRPFLVLASNVNLTLKIGLKDAMIWAVDLRNFELISEAAVSIFTQDGELLGSGLTDADGIFSVALDPLEDLSSVYYALLGQPGDDIFSLALSTWNQGLEGWNSKLSIDYQAPQTMAYLYSDRTIYQPGQTIFFRAVVRQVYNGRYSWLDVNEIPDGLISVSLVDQFGDEITVFNLPISDFGTVNGSFTLPPGMEPGNYNLVINEVSDASLEFQVVSGGVPGIELAVNISEEHILAGQRIQAVVKVSHKFGAPAAAVPIMWALYKEPATFDLPGYHVGALDTRWLNPQPDPLVDPFHAAVLEGEGFTDNQGEMVLEFPTATEDGYFRFVLT